MLTASLRSETLFGKYGLPEALKCVHSFITVSCVLNSIGRVINKLQTSDLSLIPKADF